MQSALDIESSTDCLRFVAEACAGDAELKREVERLIAAADDADSFIESPVWTNGGLLDSIAKKNIRDSLDEQIKRDNVEAFAGDDNFTGRKIGVFQLVKELGQIGRAVV